MHDSLLGYLDNMVVNTVYCLHVYICMDCWFVCLLCLTSCLMTFIDFAMCLSMQTCLLVDDDGLLFFRLLNLCYFTHQLHNTCHGAPFSFAFESMTFSSQVTHK